MYKKSQAKPVAKMPPPGVTSRDTYGFAVRPQHAGKYKEYGPIYQEEEKERAERWEAFLQRSYPAASGDTASQSRPASVPDAETLPEESDRPAEANSEGSNAEDRRDRSLNLQSSNLSVSGSDGGSRDWTAQVQKEWPSSLRTSLWPVEKVIDLRDRRRARQVEQRAAAAAKAQRGGEKSSRERKGKDEGAMPEATEQLVRTRENGDEAAPDLLGSLGCKGSDSRAEGESGGEAACEWEAELRALVKGGVPMYLRGELWQLFAGAKKRQVPGHYQALLLLLADGGGSGDGLGGLLEPAKLDPHSPYKVGQKDDNIMEKWTAQIEKDLPRTFPGHPVLDGGGRDALRRLLTAFARHNPTVGYCQGMNFLAALLLLLMPEEAAFWTLTALVDDLLQGYYCHHMIESQVDQLVLDELVRKRFPTVVAHLDSLGVQVPWVSGPWFLSVFVNVLPWESVLRVWDVLLFEDNRTMLFRTALALIDMNAPALSTVRDAGDAVSLMQTMAGGTFDSSALVLTACMGFAEVESSLLETLAAAHRPQVVAEVLQRQAEREAALREPPLTEGDLHAGSPSEAEASTSRKGEATPGSLARGMSKLWRSKTEAAGRSAVALRSRPAAPEHAETDEQGSQVDDLRAQIAWLKGELCVALEAERAASLRADELEAALVQVADKRHLDETKRSLQAQVEQLTEAMERLQRELDTARGALREREAQAQHMVEVLAKIDTEQRETEEARVQAAADVVRYQHTQHALEAQVAILRAELAASEERARQAENMLEAVHRSSLEAGGGRSGNSSPLPYGGQLRGHTAARSPGPHGSSALSSPGLLTPDGSEPKAANNKKALFGLSMKWLSDKKVPPQAKEPSSSSLDGMGLETESRLPDRLDGKVADASQDGDHKDGNLESVPL